MSDAMDQPVESLTPYPGLRSFLRSEFDIFYGRDDHVSDMLDKLAENQFLCVTGPSGCGKSSLARTGLFNALEAGFLGDRGSDWIYCDLYPETDPLDRLASALAKAIVTGESGRGTPDPNDEQVPVVEELRNLFLNHIERRSSNLNEALDGITLLEGRPIVILVDQFEEIFRYAQDDPHEASRFVDVLLKTTAARRDVYVVITIRTDELEKCSRYSGLTSAINHSQFLTPTLDRFQMQEAIEGPISLFGGTIEPELAVWLLNGLEEQLDKLPLMQHALRLLYIDARRKQPEGHVTIGLSDFFRAFDIAETPGKSRSGGHDALRMSLSHRLDKIYNGLSSHDQKITRGLFCALTTLNSRGRDIRRPIKLIEAAATLDCSFDELVAVISAFKDGTESYLRVAGEFDGIDPDDTVDVTHECVLRLWQPLRDTWLPEESASASNIRFLARLAYDRETTARGGLWDRLIGSGLLRKNARKRHSEWWATRRPNAAWAERHLAHLNWVDDSGTLSPRDVFERVRGFVRKSERYAVYEKATLFGVVALALVVGAAIVVDRAGDRRALAQAELDSLQKSEELAQAKLLLAEQKAQQEEADARATRQEAARQTLSAIQPTSYAQDPFDVAFRAASALDYAIEVNLDPASLDFGQRQLRQSLTYIHELRRFGHGPGAVNAVYAASFLDGATQIVTLTEGLELFVWDRYDNSEPIRVVPLAQSLSRGDGLQGRSMAVATNGTIAVGTQRGAVLLVENLTNGRAPPTVTELYAGPAEWGYSTISKLDFSADGRFLIAGSLTGHIHVWQRMATGRWGRHRIFTSRNLVARGDGETLDLADGSEYAPRSARIWSVAFSPDGVVAAFGRQDGTVCLMTPDGLTTTCSKEGHSQAVKGLSFSPDGNILASGGNDDAVRLWRLSRQAGDTSSLPAVSLSDGRLWQDSDIWDLSFNNQGSLLAATSWDGTTFLYRTDEWRPLTILRSHQRAPRTVEFAPESNEVLTAALDNTARIWTPFASRLTDYSLSGRVSGNSAQVQSVAMGPKGKWVGYTDRTTIWSKAQNDKATPIYVASDADASPQMLASSQAGDVMMASMYAPAVRTFRRTATGEWTDLEIPLTGDALNFRKRGRKLAMSDDGRRFAVHVGGSDGEWILVCETESDVCGSAKSDHIALVRFQAEVETSRSEGHACRRPAFPTSLALSPDGARLAVGGSDCNIRLYDLDPDTGAGTLAKLAQYHVGNITALDFSSDGSFVVAGSADWQGSVWWPETDAIRLLQEHRSTLTGARALPAGEFVATISNDEHLIIWDTATGAPQADYQSFTETLNSLDVRGTDDGIKLAVGTRGGNVVVQQFFVAPQKFLDFARTTLDAITGEDK
ncbi:nSTAND1 domain-containing NTPase [Primorskyibacter marinus]|uniref:nSTAND1 domain-containing NTPase n=1 Tax=Primorskyibacter marinus TaxID=1977320 RepID=UPI000E309758|nr:AAA family ATPase [Primorskyibacter marinus]